MTISSVMPSDLATVWHPTLHNSIVLIEFYEPSGFNHPSMLEIGNYSIKTVTGESIRIDSVMRVIEIIDGYGNIYPTYSTIIALKTERFIPKQTYIIKATNIRNNAGVLQAADSSRFYFNGFHPNLISQPEVDIK